VAQISGRGPRLKVRLKLACEGTLFILQRAMQQYTTVARWPNFRPNNLKEAPNNCSLLEKIGGRKIAKFWQKVAEKRSENIFMIHDEKPYDFG
jgi:hypothetical protein